MTHRTKHGRFAPLAAAAGFASAIVAICVVALEAAAQALPAAPPIVVYVTPAGQLQSVQNMYLPRDAAVAAQSQPATPPAARHASRPAVPPASPTSVRPASLAEETEIVTKTSYQIPADSSDESSDYTTDGPPCDCGPYVDGCGPSCGPCLSLIAGMELTWVKPEIDDGTLRANLVDTAGVGRDVTYELDDFDAEDVQIAPRFWLGLQGHCWGVVGRVWWLDDTESDHSIFIGGADVGYDFASELDMYTIDLEVTRNFCFSNGDGLATFGVRHARADRNGSLDFIGETPDGVFASFARFGQSFEGTGLTGSLSATKPVYCGSGIHWFYGIRGSILWGDSSIYSDTAALTDAGAFARNTAVAGLEDELFIGEAQLGLQWQHYLQCAPAAVFVRTAFEFQTWSAPSGSTEAESFAGFGTSLLTTRAATEGIDLNLFGFGIATGLNW